MIPSCCFNFVKPCFSIEIIIVIILLYIYIQYIFLASLRELSRALFNIFFIIYTHCCKLKSTYVDERYLL